MPFGNRKKNKKLKKNDLFSLVFSQFQKYHHSGNLNFKNLGVFESLKLRYLM